MRKFIDLDHPFFVPPWRRHLTVTVALAWGFFELSMGAYLWALLFLGLGGIALYQFRTIDWSKYDNGA